MGTSLIIWPLTKTAKRAISEQQYLTLYEQVGPRSTKSTIQRLQEIVASARRSIASPAVEDAVRLYGELFVELEKNVTLPEITSIGTDEFYKLEKASTEGTEKGYNSTTVDR